VRNAPVIVSLEPTWSRPSGLVAVVAIVAAHRWELQIATAVALAVRTCKTRNTPVRFHMAGNAQDAGRSMRRGWTDVTAFRH